MKTTVTLMRRHSLVSYFLIAFAFSWAIWIPMAVAGVRVYQGSGWPTHIPGLFGPMVAGFVMSALVAGRAGIVDLLRRMFKWRVELKWYLAALSPLAFFALAAGVMEATGQGWPELAELGKFSGLPVMIAPVMWVVMLLVNSYPEEIGWRGFAVPQLLKTRSLLTTALVIGVFWALWHVPSMFVIQNYRELGLPFIPGFLLGIIAGSIFLAWLYRATGGSVFIVAVWHATYNLFAGTAAAHGLVAAMVSIGVMACAILIVIVEARSGLRARRSHAGLRPTAG